MKGNAFVKNSEWTLIKTLDYFPLLSTYNHLKSNILSTVKLLKKKPFTLYTQYKTMNNHSHDNQLLILNQYLKKSDSLIQQLFPEKLPIRIKRELLDGIGSVIRFITGNLDAKDGKRYDEAIQRLTQSSDIQKTILQEQTVILNTTINSFNENIQKLALNQKTIAQNLQDFILKYQNTYSEVTGNLLTISTLLEATQTLQLFINTFMELETSLTFAQNQQIHLSLIDNDELMTSLSTIPIYLDKIQNKDLQLPYPVEYSTLHLYESLIKIKVYQIETSFTFIYEIPLIQKSTEYQLIQLIPIPAYYKDQLFQIIIPTFNLLLFSKEISIPVEMRNCLSLSDNRYFCQKENHYFIPNSKLCETQLLSFSKNQTCKPFIFSLSEPKIIQLTKNTWIFSSPTEVVCEIYCINTQYKQTLINTQLIHLTPNCTAKVTYQNSLFTFVASSKGSINLNVATIGKINLNSQVVITSINKSIDLSHVDVNRLQKEQIKLTENKEKLTQLTSPIVHHLSISFIIIIIVFVIIITCLFAYVFYKRKMLLLKLITALQIPVNTPNDVSELPTKLLQCKV